MPLTRLLRTALATAVVATALAPLSHSSAGGRCFDEKRRTRPDGWIALRPPAFSNGDQSVTDWAASPFFDGFVVATNGSAVVRTLDAGCSWEEVYAPGISLSEGNLLSTATIYGVAISPSTGRLGHAAYIVAGDGGTSRVVTSTDLGETWTEQPSVGLPVVKLLRSVHVSADPRIAYVVADTLVGDPLELGVQPEVETGLYVTRDGGLTFSATSRGLNASQYTEIAVDPADPRSVWSWDAKELYHSTDSGATFTMIEEADGPISTVNVSHYPPYLPARVTAFRSRRMMANRSDDGGLTWRAVPTAGRITGAANLYSQDVLATASELGVVIEAFGRAPLNVTPRGLTLEDLAWSSSAKDITLYGGDGADLFLRRFTPQVKDVVKPKLPPVELRGAGVLRRGPTTLSPKDKVVRLKPGERKTLDYTLDMAPVPTKLDIFFATDSTGSMSGVISSLRTDLQTIIDDLADSGIDTWFGVGDFKDYPAPYGGSDGDHPYKRFRKVGPIDDELEDAIAAITTGGGNRYDSALAATYQAATGEGQRAINEAGDAAGWWVKPGQGAEWREDALKVMVIAADVRSRDPKTDKGYVGPSYKQVIDALNLLEIEHVGLAVGGEEPYQSLSRVSRGTKTVAPPGGTDCDDDGDIDVDEGMPLVCQLSGDGTGGNGIAPAMVGMIKSLKDLQSVTFGIRGDRRVATVSGPAVYGGINVKASNLLKYKVEARCDYATSGETYKHRIEARVAEALVASTSLTVVCAGIPGRPRPVPNDVPPPAVRVLVAAAVPPPPPPPQPVPQTNPNPNPQGNPNPNPQPAAQAQVGVAAQEQSQVELALAQVDVHVDDELAMSGLRDGDAAAAGVLCAGLVLSAAAAAGLRRRTRTAPAVARVRSSG